MIKCLIFSCGLVALASALSLPNYIKPCKKEDPNLNDCALKQTKAAFPFVTKGDKKLKSPALNPLQLPLLEVDTGPNLKLKLVDLSVNGLEDIEFTKANFDTKANKAHLELFVTLNFVGKYEINGKILVLPIEGKGNTNITFGGASITYDMDWDVVDRNNEKYIKLKNHKLDMKLKNARFHFENLFNGDKLLGDNMNMVLNDNWEDVMKEVGPGISHTIEIIVHNIMKSYFEQIPYKQLFV